MVRIQLYSFKKYDPIVDTERKDLYSVEIVEEAGFQEIRSNSGY